MQIKKLRLTHFRNAKHIVLDDFQRINYIVGSNGAGKTNILDSLTRFVSPVGLKNQYVRFCTNAHYPDQGWSVRIMLEKQGAEHQLTTGLKPSGTHRVIQHFGEKITQKQATELMPCLWLTPVGEKIFLEEAADIRAYFHYMIGLFFSDFQEKYGLYERACKQRLRILLDDAAPNMAWLSALEGEIASMALEIMQMRQAFLERFHRDKIQHDPILSEGLPQYQLSFACTASEVKDIEHYMALLKESRINDRSARRTLFGPHRVKWIVKNLDKNIDISYCSTGEQKAVLMAILFVINQSLISVIHVSPLILLDDAYAHFDKNRMGFMNAYLETLENNIFLTGTDFQPSGYAEAARIHIHEEMMQGDDIALF